MRHSRFVLAAVTLVTCCGVYARQQNDSHQKEKPSASLREVYKLKEQIDRLEAAATQKSLLLDRAVSELSEEEKAKVEFLRPGGAVALALRTQGTVLITDGSSLVGDQVVFVRRSKSPNVVEIVGKGRITHVSHTEAYAEVTDTDGSGVRPQDEAYISSRGNSPISLTKIRL